MGIELGHHINQLLEAKAESLSVVADNHSSHRNRPASSSVIRRRAFRLETEEGAVDEEDDIVTELLFPKNLGSVSGVSFSIVSDNPRTHVRPKKKKPATKSSRLVHSSSAPAIPCGRWEVGVASPKFEKTEPRKGGLGSNVNATMMRIPIRRSSGSKQSSNENNSIHNTSANASWGNNEGGATSIKSAVSCMDKKRLKSLGLGSFSSSSQQHSSTSSAAKKQLGAARWSIPKRGSDSALIYPQRS